MLHTTVSTSTCLHLENSSVETPPLWQITTTCNIQPKLFFTMRTSLLQGTIRYTPFSFCLFTVHSLDQPQYKQSLDQPIKSQSGYKTTHKIYTYSRKYCLQSVSTLLYHGLTATTSPSLYIYKEMEKQLTCIWNLHEQSPKETKTNNKYKIVTNVMKHIYIYYTDIFYTYGGALVSAITSTETNTSKNTLKNPLVTENRGSCSFAEPYSFLLTMSLLCFFSCMLLILSLLK